MARSETTVNDQDLEQLAMLFRLLSDRTRLSILLRLGDGERNVTALCQELDLPQPTVSHHLALLRMSNIVGTRRAGKQVYYTLNGTTSRDAENKLVLFTQNHTVRIG